MFDLNYDLEAMSVGVCTMTPEEVEQEKVYAAEYYAEVNETLSFNLWLDKVKELGGYYEQPDEMFYHTCWTTGLTPHAVTDYLNQPLEK